MAVCLKPDRLHIDGQASAPTDSDIQQGDLYYNTTDDTLYRYNQDNEWVGVGGGAIIISETEPDVSGGVSDAGILWFDTGSSAALWVWDGYSWIQILDPEASNRAIASATAPSNPVVGDTWFDLPNGNLYVWNGSWIQVTESSTAHDELTDMSDVTNAASASAGQVLQSNGNGTFSFVNNTASLIELTDITNASSASAGQILQTNSNNSTYTFVTPEENLGDLSNVFAAGNNNNSLNKIFTRTGTSTFGFITHEHALADLTDVEVPADTAAADADEDEYVLTADGDGTYSFQELTGAIATYGPTPPADPSVGELWFDNNDNDAAGLYVYDGYNWIRSTAQPPSEIPAYGLPASESGTTYNNASSQTLSFSGTTGGNMVDKTVSTSMSWGPTNANAGYGGAYMFHRIRVYMNGVEVLEVIAGPNTTGSNYGYSTSWSKSGSATITQAAVDARTGNDDIWTFVQDWNGPKYTVSYTISVS